MNFSTRNVHMFSHSIGSTATAYRHFCALNFRKTPSKDDVSRFYCFSACSFLIYFIGFGFDRVHFGPCPWEKDEMKIKDARNTTTQHNDDAFNILVRELKTQKLEINLSKIYTIETGVRCSNSIQFRTNFSSHGFVSIKFNRFYCLFEIEKSNTIKSKAF